MKKTLFSFAMLLIGVSTMAQSSVAIGTDVTVAQIENGSIYTIQGYRNGWKYMVANASSTNTQATTTTAYSSEATNANEYQWTYYTSESGYRYLFSIGKGKFMDASGNFVSGDVPTSHSFIIKDSKITSATAIMMSADNGTSAMHCSNQSKITNWSGAYSNETADVCAFKVTKVAELDEVTYQAIQAAVATYEAPVVVPAKLVDLNTVIEELEALELLVGEGFGKYSCSDKDYASKIDALRAYHTVQSQEASATIAEINAKIADANALIPLFAINTPADGTFLRISPVAVANGYLVSDVPGTGTSGRAQVAEGTGEEANTIFYYTGGKLLSYATGTFFTGGDFLESTKAVVEGVNFGFVAAQSVTDYCVVFGSRYLYSKNAGDTNAASIDGGEGYAFTLSSVESLPVSIGTSGYATFYSPVAVTLPTGLEAYYVSEKNESSAKMEAISNVIPANTGVVLKGTAGETYTLTIGGNANAVSNLLEGTVADTYVAKNAYVLAQPEDNTVGFYLAEKNQNSGAAFLNNGFKAYLPAEAASSVRFISFDFGTETAIESIESVENNAVVYDLAGRRVQGAQKGIFIVNGKKVIK